MTEITVTKEETGPRSGRYVARVAGIDSEAELTFTHRGEGLISADHTGAPDPLRGSGAAPPRLLARNSWSACNNPVVSSPRSSWAR